MSKSKGDDKLRELLEHLGYSSEKEFYNHIFNMKGKTSPNEEYTYTVEGRDVNNGTAIISDSDGHRIATVDCQRDQCCTFQGSKGYLWNPVLVTSLSCPVYLGGAKKKTRRAKRTKSRRTHCRSKKSM